MTPKNLIQREIDLRTEVIEKIKKEVDLNKLLPLDEPIEMWLPFPTEERFKKKNLFSIRDDYSLFFNDQEAEEHHNLETLAIGELLVILINLK